MRLLNSLPHDGFANHPGRCAALDQSGLQRQQFLVPADGQRDHIPDTALLHNIQEIIAVAMILFWMVTMTS